MSNPTRLSDFAPNAASMFEEVMAGLQKPQKELPCKLFYDEAGSRLFERITELDEYYLTRTETAIMQEFTPEITALLGERCMLIEYGSGNSEKTKILLDHMSEPTAYVPIDISREHLMHSAARVAATYPGLDVLPVCADYTDSSFVIPPSMEPETRRIVYYPGSTIGNFHVEEAIRFLERIAGVCGKGGGLVLGVDLKKTVNVLLRAYNDALGVTAEFNLNLLVRINRELNANFPVDRFRHVAVYNDKKSRIEMYLVSTERQTVLVNEIEVHFEKGESIWTESSYKYTLDEFSDLAKNAGFHVSRVWTDSDRLFSVQYLTT